MEAFARLVSIVVLLSLVFQIVGFATPARASSSERPALAVQRCSDSDTPADRDFLPILAIRGGQPNLFLFETVLSSSHPYQYVRACSSGDFGVTWGRAGQPVGANGILTNLTWATDYPDSRELLTVELWQPGSPTHFLLGPWFPADPPWSHNASAASAAIALRSPHYAVLAFQRGDPPSVFFTTSGDYWGFGGQYYNWTTPSVVAGASGPMGPAPSGIPSLAIDPMNRVHLLYLRSDPTGRRDVYYLRNDDRGRDDGWTPEPGRLLSRSTADNHDAVIATSREGETVVAIWTATQPGGDDDLMYAYSPDAGLTWSPTRNFAATAYHEGNPVIAVDPLASSFHVAYWRDDSIPGRMNNILYMQAAWGDPANWTSPQSLVDTGAIVSDTYRRPAITSYWRGGTNHIVSVAWTDLRNGDEDLYMTDLDLLECAASAAPASGLAPLSVTFGATASGGTPPYNYAWRFGDGANGAGPSVLHTYTQTGTYDASLLVTDAAGNTCFDGVPIHVLSPLPDLAVFRSEIVLSAPPYVEGSPLAVHAIVHNLGGASVANATVRLALGSPGGPSLGNRTVSSIPSMGNASVSFSWTPASGGTYTLCVVADPDNTIPESNEGNNAGCTSLGILGRPDLAILAGDVAASPGAVPLGGTVDVNATVRNLGSSPAAGVLVTFFTDANGNRVPDAGESFADRTIPSLSEGTTTSLSSTWTASALGPQTLCAYADPDDAIPEGEEANNGECAVVTVLGPPDYVPGNPQPSAPIVAGLSRPLTFSVEVRNDGDAPANVTTRLVLYNASTPVSPFASFDVPPLAAGETAGPFPAAWVSPAAPGPYAVTARVDADDGVAESDEANNVYTWTIDVVPGPVTTLVVGQPNVTAGVTYVTSATDLSFSVLDQGGTGIRSTRYQINGTGWIDYAGPFSLSVEGEHVVEWFSEDNAGNVEAAQSAVLRVDDTPPTTSLAIGDPKYLVGGTFVTSATPLSLSADDGGVTPVGVLGMQYQLDGGGWLPYVAPFTLSGEGPHSVEYRSLDLLGNEEPASNATIVVDDSPPSVDVTFGTPAYTSTDTWVTSRTPLQVTASDDGPDAVGLERAQYQVDGGGWTPYTSPFTLSGDGPHLVEARARDHLGNGASVARSVIVDDTAPFVSLAVGDPRFQSATLYVTSATPISLAASDPGSNPVGLESAEFRIDGGAWVPYSAPFTLPGSDGLGRVEYAATDRLGNRNAAAVDLIVDDTPPETEIAPRAGPHTPDTAFTLTPTDPGSGVAGTEYRVDDGAWSPFAGGFSLPLGNHTIRYRSVDHLNNTEAERALSVTIEGAPPPVPEANWKPLVAALFTAVLALAGWRASRSRWAHARIPRKQRIKVFATMALPFVVAEAATGIVSALTGLLSIPPIIGVGTAVDLGILAAGLGAAVYESRRWKPPGARSSPGNR